MEFFFSLLCLLGAIYLLTEVHDKQDANTAVLETRIATLERAAGIDKADFYPAHYGAQ